VSLKCILVTRDQAREYFQRAVEANNVDGYYNLGILYLKGLGVDKDYARARNLLLDAANRGHPKARYYLAKMLHKGLAGMKKDLGKVSPFRMIQSVSSTYFLFPKVCGLYVVTLFI
jgi:TPR repeat protein